MTTAVKRVATATPSVTVAAITRSSWDDGGGTPVSILCIGTAVSDGNDDAQLSAQLEHQTQERN